MSKPKLTGMLFFGVITVGLASLVFIAGNSQPVKAQAVEASEAGPVFGRYQISSYGYGLGDGSPGSLSEHGAYILDTTTGDVFVLRHHGAPKFLGSVARTPRTAMQLPAASATVGLTPPNAESIELPHGIPREEAAQKLKAMGFESWEDGLAPRDEWVRYRKPWQRGFHFINIRFENDKVAEVVQIYNDP